MTVEQFESALREVVHRKPFQPFEVELLDGRVLVVDTPVAFNSDRAFCVSVRRGIINFARGDVKEIRRCVVGAPS